MNGIGSAGQLRAIGRGRPAGRPPTATQLDAPPRRVDPRRGARHRAKVWTKLPDPYSTEAELIEAVRATGVLEITAARADRDRLHPALDCAAGGPYDRLRAVHDIVGHVMTGYGFDRDGEYSAWLRQSRLYHGLARWAAATELHAEHSVVWTTGQFPEHKGVLLPRRLLRRSSSRRGA